MRSPSKEELEKWDKYIRDMEHILRNLREFPLITDAFKTQIVEVLARGKTLRLAALHEEMADPETDMGKMVKLLGKIIDPMEVAWVTRRIPELLMEGVPSERAKAIVKQECAAKPWLNEGGRA